VKADSLPRRFIALAIAWLLVAALLAFQLWPDLPKSYLQWILLVLFGPPLYVLGEALFGWLFSPRHGQSISRRPFSPARILVALPVVLAFLALSWWLSWLLTRAA
jgi:hypothetical protein